MPDLSAQLTTLRADGHEVRYYAGFWLGSAVWSGTVSATPSYPAKALSVGTTAGTVTAARRGFRVVIESSGGAYKGETTVRFGGTLDADSLPIRELSRAEISIASGDTFEVLYDVPPGDKLVEATTAFDPDGVDYSDQGSDPPPVPISGGHYAGWVDAGQTYADVTMPGTNSYTVDPDSAGNITHLWTVISGSGTSFTTGTSASAAPVIRFPAAANPYLVRHRVTDDTNSKSQDQYVKVAVHNPAAADRVTRVNAQLAALEWAIDGASRALVDRGLAHARAALLAAVDEMFTYGDLQPDAIVDRVTVCEYQLAKMGMTLENARNVTADRLAELRKG